MDIIVAEDHPVSAKLLEKIIKKTGHTVHLAADGEEAWEFLLRHKARMLLTDWMMPRLDGLALCRRVREKLSVPYVYLILLTAKDATADILAGFEAGADDYIAKPVNPDELMARIRVGLRHLALEDRHEKTLRHLMRTEKMASLGQLSAGMAHEINNPLGFLISNIKTLASYHGGIEKILAAYQKLPPLLNTQENALAPLLREIRALEEKNDLAYILEDAKALISESGEGAARIQKIIEDMRIFTHPDAMVMELVDIHTCIETSLSMVQNRFAEGIRIVRNFQELPRIQCFQGQIQHAFCNIFMNAMQSMAGQGTLHIETSRKEDQLLVCIRDTGCGITPEILPRIFDPFFTTRPVGQGTGLGLHVSYTLIQRHGGHIEVNSIPGTGSAFEILLPLESPANGNTTCKEKTHDPF